MTDDYSKPDLMRLDERLAQIAPFHGYRRLDLAGFEPYLDRPGTSLVLFAEDPLRVPETWDLAVILVDVVKRIQQSLNVALLPPDTAVPLAGRYGISRWPTLVVLRDGGYVGAIEGMQDWTVLRRRLDELLVAPVRRLPGIGIAVHSAPATHACH